MEHLILEDTAVIMPFLQISVVPIATTLVSMLLLLSLEGSCAKAVVCIHLTALKSSTHPAFCLLTPSLSSMTLLYSLDLMPLSGLPGFDSWFSLKDFGLTLDGKLFRAP